MPAALQAYIDSRSDLLAVREVQRELVGAYINDITKYAGTQAPNVRAIFEQLPLQLDAKFIRFQLNSLEPHARYEKFRFDFNWLVSAHVAMKCNIVKDPKSPLSITQSRLVSNCTNQILACSRAGFLPPWHGIYIWTIELQT